ncbi:hypothetical protein [Rhodoflexus caldus]|uniref:hypothetical protein n=1 Tax=Rhodoflexus caldus TaxID=2891236 RepID=UPI00202A7FCF|nr:hypothetical protein [Rhodoflexus caldus]
MYGEKRDNSQKSQNASNFGRFERLGSTFRWRICFYNGTIRIGYSKPLGQAEPFAYDKTQLMQAILRRLLIKNGYLQKIQSIEWFRVCGHDEKEDYPMFSLYPAEWRFAPNMLQDFSKGELEPLREILDSFYTSPADIYGVANPSKPTMGELLGIKKAPEPPKDSLPNLDTMMSKSYIGKIKSWTEFENIVRRMRADKRFQVGEVNAFMSKAIENNPVLQK